MNRRKNHKILRGFKTGHALENTFELAKTDKLNSFFSSESEHLLVYYKYGVRYCVMEQGFPYFYRKEEDGSFTFDMDCSSDADFLVTEHYSNFDHMLTLFRKFDKSDNPHAEQFFLDAYAHYKTQSKASFGYSYNLDKDDHHVLTYTIKSNFSLTMEFHFLKSTVVLRCEYKDSKKSKNNVKIIAGNFESVCRQAFTENKIFSCLDDEIVDFYSDFEELFTLSEIVDI